MKLFKLFLDELYGQLKGKTLIAPVVAAAAVNAAASIGAKIIADIKAKRAAEEVDKQREEELAENRRLADEQVQVGKGIVKQGDPTLARKLRMIKKTGADTVGRATATSTSTQEILNAAEKVQQNVNQANEAALTSAGQFDIQSRKLLGSLFGQAGRQRLMGRQIINQESQAALDAIGANAQSLVDSVQSVGQIGVQAVGLNEQLNVAKKKPLRTFNLPPNQIGT